VGDSLLLLIVLSELCEPLAPEVNERPPFGAGVVNVWSRSSSSKSCVSLRIFVIVLDWRTLDVNIAVVLKRRKNAYAVIQRLRIELVS
jgi:hypothetical protein